MDTLPRPHDDEAALHPHRLVKAAYPHYGADAADLTVQGAVPGPAGVSAAPATWPRAADLAAGRLTLVALDAPFDPAVNPLTWMAAHAGARVYGVVAPEGLPSWARPSLLHDADLGLRLYGPVNVTGYDAAVLDESGETVFCARYALINRHTGAELAVVTQAALLVSHAVAVEVVDEAIYRGADLTPEPGDGMFFVPDGEVSGAVVRQARDGWDIAAQAAEEQACFAAFLAVEREDYLAALRVHLEHTAGYFLHHLRGQTVTLRVDAAGRPRLSVPAA